MRSVENWIDSYLEYTQNSESPTNYHKWCALSVIAGALQRRVYLRWGIGSVIYPNMYIVLVGPSGKTRKGSALGIAKDMLKEMSGVTIAPESSSGKQAMIGIMKRLNYNFQDPSDGKIKYHCALTAFSEELSVFLGQKDIAYLATLTDWYDSKDTWEYETVGRGKESISGVCLNLIGGTAPDWLQSMLPQEAIGGGFSSRVIFVVETKKGKIVPEPFITPRELELQEQLRLDLERINQLSGEMHMSDEARKLYVNWYIKHSEDADSGIMSVNDPRFAGYNERRPTHLRKLMMLCSAARNDSLILEREDFERATRLLTDVEKNMAMTFGGLGQSRTSEATEAIKNYIQRVKITTRKMILQRFYRDVDSQTLTQVEETLRQMGCIKVKLLIEQQDKSYEWIDD